MHAPVHSIDRFAGGVFSVSVPRANDWAGGHRRTITAPHRIDHVASYSQVVDVASVHGAGGMHAAAAGNSSAMLASTPVAVGGY